MSWNRLLIPASAIPIIWLLAFGLTRDPNLVRSPLPGRPAFDFAAPVLDGDSLQLSSLQSKVVVLNFWASWCIPCLQEHPHLMEVERRYGSEEVQIIGVIYQDTEGNARSWTDRMGGDWPSIIDEDSRIAIDYGVYGVPETYFIGADGLIAYKHVGPLNRELLMRWVETLLAKARLEQPGETASAEGL